MYEAVRGLTGNAYIDKKEGKTWDRDNECRQKGGEWPECVGSRAGVVSVSMNSL